VFDPDAGYADKAEEANQMRPYYDADQFGTCSAFFTLIPYVPKPSCGK